MQQYVADAIAMVNVELRVRNLPATAEFLYDGPQLLTLLIRSAFGVDPRRIKILSAALADRIGTDSVVVHQNRMGMLVQIAKPERARGVLRPHHIDMALSRVRSRMPCSAIPVGLDVAGSIVWLDLANDTSSHAICLGMTGSGKSSLLQWLAYRLIRQNLPEYVGLVAISTSSKDFDCLAGVPHLLHPPVITETEARQVFSWLDTELTERKRTGKMVPALVVLCDEVQTWAETDDCFTTVLDTVAREGRKCGIHLLAGSQRGSQSKVGGLIYNMPVRFVGRLGSSQYNWGAAGRSGAQADELLGNGDFLMASANQLTRLQVPLMSPNEWSHLDRGFSRVLALPEPIVVEETATAGNATELTDTSLTEIAARFRGGESIRKVMAEYSIGYNRAKKLQSLAMEGLS